MGNKKEIKGEGEKKERRVVRKKDREKENRKKKNKKKEINILQSACKYVGPEYDP